MVAKVKNSKSKVKKSSKVVKKAAKAKKITKSLKKPNKVVAARAKAKIKTKVKAKSKAKVKVTTSKVKSRPQSKPKLKTISTAASKKKKGITISIKPVKKAAEVKKSTIKSSSVAKKKPLLNNVQSSLTTPQDIFAEHGFGCHVGHATHHAEHDFTEKKQHHIASTNTDPLLSGPTSKFEPYRIHTTEEYMNEQQLQHFTNILESWKKDLMVEVDHTITEMKEADILADPNDRATQEETFNLELRARDRERKLIKKIETALKKIKDHEYGYCDSCGVEIGVRRLEARPTATLCIECKTLAEMREKRV